MNTNEKIEALDTNLLQPNPFQPRSNIDREELDELSSSIKAHGILEPLVVAHTPAGYQIIAGERRWRAAKIAGLSTVPVIIRKTSPKGMLEMALIENVQRVNLHPLERAKAFQQLKSDFGLTFAQVAERIGKSIGYISNSMRLLNLPDAVKDGLAGGLITEGHARALGGLDDARTMIEVYKRLLKENASVRRAEELVRLYKSRVQQPDKNKPEVFQIDNDEILHWQKNLQKILASPSKVKLSRSAKHTRITITLQGSMSETQKDLERIMALAQKAK